MKAPPKLLNERLEVIPLERITPDPLQPRKVINHDDLINLGSSLLSCGSIYPIRVRRDEKKNGHYILIAGERRYRGAKMSGIDAIPCLISQRSLNRAEILEQQLVDNLLRENLSPIDEAHAFKEMMRLKDWSATVLAEKLHLSKAYVSKSMALLKLSQETQEAVHSGKIPRSTGYSLSSIRDRGEREKLADQASRGLIDCTDAAEASKKSRRKGHAGKSHGSKVTFRQQRARVSVSARGELSEQEISAALAGAYLQSAILPSKRSGLTAKIMIEILTALSSGSTDLAVEVDEAVAQYGTLVLAALFNNDRQVAADVRAEMIARINALDRESKLAFHSIH